MAGTSTTTFVRIINGTEINTLGTITTVFNIGQSGASAYQSYLATTTDDPKKTEAEWSSGFVQLQSDWNQTVNTEKDFIKNKPTIPVIDPYTVIDADYVHTDNNYDDAAVLEVAKIADKQDATDALLETDSDTIVGAINEVNSIAKGANQALSFDNYQDVIAAMLVNGLNAGQNLYVDTSDVPDLWVKVVEVASVPYTYISDTQFITDILAGTQIGYYKLALLETQKVDLTNYYTKDETDQAIEDYAEPLRTTNQNYVSDAELEVLQETSGVNTGDETQDTIGDLIELTELETVTDTTKIAASDSAFLKWFSGLTIYTYLKGKFDTVYAKISDYFSKTESDRRFVNQNGGTIYHITRWFTPTSSLLIEAGGLTAQQVGATQFTAGMIGAKLKLTNGANEPIITAVDVPNRRITLSFAVGASFFGQSVAVADWGVYNKAFEIDSTGNNIKFYQVGGAGLGATISSGYNWIGRVVAGNGKHYFDDGYMQTDSSGKWAWTATAGNAAGAKDLGLRRMSAGLMEIFDGVTAGALRDLKLRSLFADMFKANLSTGFTFKNSSDVDVFAIDNNGFQLDQYDDVLPSDAWTPASGGAAPDITTHTIGGMAANYRSFDGGNTEETMVNTFEILHGIDVDALNRATAPLLAEVHTHGMPSTALAGVVKIFYDIVYQGVNAAPISLGTFSNLITVNANEQYWHKLGGVEFTKPTGGFAIGGQLIVNYRRNPSDAQDTYTGDWLFMQCALHMPFNSNGSRQRYIK